MMRLGLHDLEFSVWYVYDVRLQCGERRKTIVSTTSFIEVPVRPRMRSLAARGAGKRSVRLATCDHDPSKLKEDRHRQTACWTSNDRKAHERMKVSSRHRGTKLAELREVIGFQISIWGQWRWLKSGDQVLQYRSAHVYPCSGMSWLTLNHRSRSRFVPLQLMMMQN